MLKHFGEPYNIKAVLGDATAISIKLRPNEYQLQAHSTGCSSKLEVMVTPFASSRVQSANILYLPMQVDIRIDDDDEVPGR